MIWICLLLGLISCSQDRVILEKGAGFYEISKKEIVSLDSLGNVANIETAENFGFITLFAKSGDASTASVEFNGEAITFPGESSFSSPWTVGPTDENRLVMRKVFTLEGWGRKNVKITYRADNLTREVFYLTRN